VVTKGATPSQLCYCGIAPMPTIFVWVNSVTRDMATRRTSYIWPGAYHAGWGEGGNQWAGRTGPSCLILSVSRGWHKVCDKALYVDSMTGTRNLFYLLGAMHVFLTYLRFPVLQYSILPGHDIPQNGLWSRIYSNKLQNGRSCRDRLVSLFLFLSIWPVGWVHRKKSV